MFSEETKTEQPFATKLFTAAINKNKLAQAYLFISAQPIVQYNFALELAKILNCSNKQNNKACNNCLDCKWINANSHPEVITISPIDFLPDKEDITNKIKVSKTKSAIKVAQSRLLIKKLSSSSKHHRVVIFTGAKDDKIPDDLKQASWLDYENKINPPHNEKELNRSFWIPTYLNYQIFPSEPANILLKTIEEPYGNILFVFIAKDPESLISTIVSRCQTISLQRKPEKDFQTVDYIQEIIVSLPPKDELDVLTIANQILNFAKTEQIDLEIILNHIQSYYNDQFKNNILHQNFNRKFITQIEKIEETKKMIQSYVNPQAALIKMLKELID